MDLKHLKTFQMVATQMSISRAAVALDYAQSTVTAQIQLLEQDLGKPLFNRIGKRIELTDAGHKLLHYANRLLELADETRRVVSDDSDLEGTIRFAAGETVISYRLPSILKAFREQMPDVRLIFRPMPYADLYRSVRDGEVDVSFMLEETMASNGLSTMPLMEEKILLIASPEHPLSMENDITLNTLSGETLLLTEQGCGYRGMFERKLLAEGIVPANYMEFDSIEAIKNCVQVNLGIAVLPEVAIARELREESLVSLNWTEENFTVHTQMLWHQNKWVSPALHNFIDLCQSRLAPESHIKSIG